MTAHTRFGKRDMEDFYDNPYLYHDSDPLQIARASIGNHQSELLKTGIGCWGVTFPSRWWPAGWQEAEASPPSGAGVWGSEHIPMDAETAEIGRFLFLVSYFCFLFIRSFVCFTGGHLTRVEEEEGRTGKQMQDEPVVWNSQILSFINYYVGETIIHHIQAVFRQRCQESSSTSTIKWNN